MRRAWLLIPLLVGCTDDSVLVRGTIFESHDPDSEPLAGATVTFVDPNTGGRGVLDEVETGRDGSFEAIVPVGMSVVAEVRGPGLVTATFPGTTGFSAVLDVEDHLLYAVSEAEVDDLRARLAGCPGADGDGAIVFGEVRIQGLEDPETGESPTTNAGRVDVWSAGGKSWAGCYLDEEGTAFDPEADRTGATGRFVVFGVKPGLHEIDVRYEFATDYWIGEAYPGWVPKTDEQVVVPLWPAWVNWQL